MPRSRAPLLAALALLAACSDYGFSKGEVVPSGSEPDIEVDPVAVYEVFCGTEATPVTVSNVGDVRLDVTAASITGNDWSLAEPFLPFSLEKDESREIVVQGEAGNGTLTLECNDPDEPVVEVQLRADTDQPPTARIDVPADGEVLPVGSDVVLTATVADPEDPPEVLTASWASSSLGHIGSAPVAADGTTTLTWPFASRPSGYQTLELQVVDGCGNAVLDSRRVCQQEGWVASELELSSWHFEGTATWDEANATLHLTEANPYEVGTAFATASPVWGESIEIRFQFYIGGGTGADGLSLTALDSSRATSFLGGTGCGIGYGGDAPCTAGPALPGWSLEVDTYFNDGQDPTAEDHLAFTFDGDVDAPVFWTPLPEMEDSGWHTLEVRVLAPHVTVTLDGTVWLDQDLAGTFAFPAYVGFTAGTGDLTNAHLIQALTVTEYACE